MNFKEATLVLLSAGSGATITGGVLVNSVPLLIVGTVCVTIIGAVQLVGCCYKKTDDDSNYIKIPQFVY